MAYIGKQPIVGNFQICDAISVVNGQAAYTMQVASTNVSPESASHMLVSLNGILQKPGSSFTISGATITFASNLVTNDVIDFIMLLGNVLDLGTPSDATVTAAKLGANAVTGAKLNTDIISAQTALATAPADTDEFMVSDGGVLKRIDYSLIKATSAHTLISTTTISNDAGVTISSGIDSTYKVYMFELINLHPNNDDVAIHLQFLQGGSLDTGSVYDYAYGKALTNGGAMTYAAEANAAYMRIADGLSSDNDGALNGRIFLYNPSDTTFDTQIMFDVIYQQSGSVNQRNVGSARIEEAAAVDGVKFFASAAEIDAGVIKLYGIT